VATPESKVEWEDLFRGKVVYLTRQFKSQSRLARLLEVDRSRVSRWLSSEAPDGENRGKLEALEFVFSRLTLFLAPETAEKWLLGLNAHLGNRRPIDLIRDGRVAEVLAALEQFEAGAYA
jgi:transcriptional regulator with XRE-family HTH domain